MEKIVEQLIINFDDGTVVPDTEHLEILSCGAGMQSTALALMSCEKKLAQLQGRELPHPTIPIYSLIVFCDLKEPEYVYDQVDFIKRACEEVGIRFVILTLGDGYGKSLYYDYLMNFGVKSCRSIPFWTLTEVVDKKTGEVTFRKGIMPRVCTLEYKINIIQQYCIREVLKIPKYTRMRSEDFKKHIMHIGFSFEERKRCKENPHPRFVNRFPLVELELTRSDNYGYSLEVWDIATKASSCIMCPYHSNFFYMKMKKERPCEYFDVDVFDNVLRLGQPHSKIKSPLFITKSCKRLCDLLPEDCNDNEYFEYNGELIEKGF